MSYHQKIECNVSSCAHNCIEDATCRLDRIMVTPCSRDISRVPEGETACSSYFYSGKLNSYSSLRSND